MRDNDLIMGLNILIITVAGDFHAHAVTWELQRRGHTVTTWIVTDYPEADTISMRLGTGSLSQLNVQALAECPVTDFDTVWFRRYPNSVNYSRIHPADREFAEREALTLLHDAVEQVAPRAFWVNDIEAAARADSKPKQLREAVSAGLTIPETLISNDPEEVREFLKSQGRIIYKPMHPMLWSADGSNKRVVYTSPINEHDLDNSDSIQLSPGIFQSNVPKAYEVRAVIMGETCLACDIESQAAHSARYDWRLAATAGDKLSRRVSELPGHVKAKCYRLMRALGLVFGVFDFIVTPDGEYVFLEVNEMGQFVGIEADAGLPVLDLFCAFLIERNPRFSKPVESGVQCLSDYLESTEYQAFRADPQSGHLPDQRALFLASSASE